MKNIRIEITDQSIQGLEVVALFGIIVWGCVKLAQSGLKHN